MNKRMLTVFPFWGDRLGRFLLLGWVCVVLGWGAIASPVLAGLGDDHYDGNIFALYGGNGSLVPPRVTLAQAMAQNHVAVLVFYLDDSRDCKQYATVVSRIQAYYGRAADLIPVNADTVMGAQDLGVTEPGHYYGGFVPQVVILNQAGEVVLDGRGQVPFEQVDDTLRVAFDLVPRVESPTLKRRAFNEINGEMVAE